MNYLSENDRILLKWVYKNPHDWRFLPLSEISNITKVSQVEVHRKLDRLIATYYDIFY